MKDQILFPLMFVLYFLPMLVAIALSTINGSNFFSVDANPYIWCATFINAMWVGVLVVLIPMEVKA